MTCGRCAFTFASGRYLCRDSQVQRPSSVRGQRPLPLPRVLRAHAIDLINNPFLILPIWLTTRLHSFSPQSYDTLFTHIYKYCITGLFMWASLLPIYLIHYSFYTTICYSVCYLIEIVLIWRLITTVHKSGLKNRFKWLFGPTIVMFVPLPRKMD